MEQVGGRKKIVGTLWAAAAAALVIALILFFFLGRSSSGKESAKVQPVVTIAVPQLRDLPIELNAQGHLVALNQVDVRPKVMGVIRSVDFREGDPVQAGQLLFTLDDSEIMAQLRRAEAGAA